ncbi:MULTISPECIES: hypothetical protein [unclassified Empedobacter]|uniref:hypothetical protein n=1 Tax=unclassified Empedobacter TaxID=2643773 RepID=UPI0024492523|nr:MULTISPECIES: hypothetical protein [unclassified Empedobacter]MDH2207811.1 hypothetical protein [Empedobacter sp. GD03644]
MYLNFNEVLDLIKVIGVWNFFSIITFLLGTVFTIYTYFKSFYRLVYSCQSVCETCFKTEDWENISNLKRTRIIFKNNGRKTITSNELKNIKIIGKNINAFKFIGIKKIDYRITNSKLQLKLDYLDANDFFVIEFQHIGDIKVKGRISETGKFLNTETKSWLILNFILVVYSLISMAVIPLISMFILEDYDKVVSRALINVIIIYLIYTITRYLHKVFFISDSIVDKYLRTKSKWNNEFKNSL